MDGKHDDNGGRHFIFYFYLVSSCFLEFPYSQILNINVLFDHIFLLNRNHVFTCVFKTCE